MTILGVNGADEAVHHPVDTFMRPRPRTRGTLLSVAREIPAEQLTSRDTYRLGAGIEWTPWPSIVAAREAIDCDVVYDKSEVRAVPELVAQDPFLLWDRIGCSTGGLDLDWLVEAARQGLDDYVTVALAAELETASGSGGFGLVGNATYQPEIVNSTAEKLALAIARLEEYLAGSKWAGALGVIHLTAGLLTLAQEIGIVEWRDGAYRTATGHAVVGDAGHTGSLAPYGESSAGTDEAWIYATGDVWYALGTIPSLDDPTDPDGGPVYVGRNQNEPLLERIGLVVFDPEVLAAALVDLTSSSEGGSDSGDSGDGDGADALADLIYTEIAEGDIAADTYHGVSLFNTHADDPVLIYIRFGTTDTSTPFKAIAIAAGQSVNLFYGPRVNDGEPVGVDGVHVTDESSGLGAATIADLVGYVITGAS